MNEEYLFIVPRSLFLVAFGEVQEWLNWQHWKCCERGTVPWVRIPPSPPYVAEARASARAYSLEQALPNGLLTRTFAIANHPRRIL